MIFQSSLGNIYESDENKIVIKILYRNPKETILTCSINTKYYNNDIKILSKKRIRAIPIGNIMKYYKWLWNERVIALATDDTILELWIEINKIEYENLLDDFLLEKL